MPKGKIKAFGTRPKVERVRIRVQRLDGKGGVSATQSFTVYEQPFKEVVGVVESALEETYGQPEDLVDDEETDDEEPDRNPQPKTKKSTLKRKGR